MAKLNTRAAIVWTSTGTGTERVVLLDVPLRELRPGFSQTAYSAQSLDKTALTTITVGSGAHELVGVVRYEDNPQGLLDLVQAGATNTVLTYIPDLADPDQSYSVYLISPRDTETLQLQLDRQRALFGEMEVEVRFRQTDRTAFTELYDGSPVLFAYTAGNSLADATFSRADTARYASKGYGTDTSAASGKARIHWMDTDADGIRETPCLLLEGASTNLVIQSTNFGAWTTSGSPVLTSGQADPAGGTSAYLIADDDGAAQEYITLTPTFTTDAVSKAVSIFLKMGTSLAASGSDIQLRDTTAGADRLLMNVTWSNGAPTVTATTGTHIGTTRYRDGWYRFLFRTTAVTVANTNALRIVPASTAAQTGNLYAYGAQAENALNPTSYNPTSGGTDTRTADSLTFPFPARVQTLTVYGRYLQMGTLPYASSGTVFFSLGTVGAETRFLVANGAGVVTFVANVQDAAGSVSSGVVAPGATHGQVVEVVAWLRVTGTTATAQLQAAVAGTIGTAGTVSAARAISDNFNGDAVSLTLSLQQAAIGTTHIRVVRGVRDMLEMRRFAGVS